MKLGQNYLYLWAIVIFATGGLFVGSCGQPVPSSEEKAQEIAQSEIVREENSKMTESFYERESIVDAGERESIAEVSGEQVQQIADRNESHTADEHGLPDLAQTDEQPHTADEREHHSERDHTDQQGHTEPLPDDSSEFVPTEQIIPREEHATELDISENGVISATANVIHAHDAVCSYLMSGSDWNYFHGATVPLGRHSNVGRTSYFTAFRFRQLNIPPNAQILSAKLFFHPHNEVDSSRRLMLNVYAEKTGNSVAYDPSNYQKNRPDQRLKTTAKIDRWIVRCRDDCSDDISSSKYEYDCAQRKKDCWNRNVEYELPKDLKAIIAEIVTQSTWQSGNAVSIFLFNAATDQDGSHYESSRTIIGYDDNQKQKAPRIVIEYQK